jgi:hypothetical protein
MIREAEERDVPRIKELHGLIEVTMGKKMDLPTIDDPAMLGFWVVEIDGTVEQFFYIEKALEICFGGSNPHATLEVMEFQAKLVNIMLKSKIRMLHCHVPQEFPDVGKHLEDERSGFTRTGYEHFHLGLVQP